MSTPSGGCDRKMCFEISLNGNDMQPRVRPPDVASMVRNARLGGLGESGYTNPYARQLRKQLS